MNKPDEICCSNCTHDGQCVHLPYCDGQFFESKWVRCSLCHCLYDATATDCDDICPECQADIDAYCESLDAITKEVL